MRFRSLKKFHNRYTIWGLSLTIFYFADRGLGLIGHGEMIWQHWENLSSVITSGIAIIQDHRGWFDFLFLCFAIALIYYGVAREKKIEKHSPFEIEYIDGETPFYASRNTQDFVEQIFRVRIWNNDKHRAIARVVVVMKYLNPEPNLLYAFPVPLRFSNDLKPPFDQARIFGELQSEFVDIVSYKHSDELPINAAQLHVEHAKSSQSQIIPNGAYRFFIEVSGDNAIPIQKEFQLTMNRETISLTTVNEQAKIIKSWNFLKMKGKSFLNSAGHDKQNLEEETLKALSHLYDEGLELFNAGFDSRHDKERWTENLDKWVVRVEKLLREKTSASALHSFRSSAYGCWKHIPDKSCDWEHDHREALTKYSNCIWQLDEIIRFRLI
jgi:hypothetical protein